MYLLIPFIILSKVFIIMYETSHSKASVFEKLAFYVLLFTTFLIPLFFVPASFISLQFGTSLLFAVGVIVAFLLYIVSVFSSGSLSIPRPAKYALGLVSLVPLMYLLAGIANGFSRMAFFGYTFDQSTVGFVVIAFVYLFLVSFVANTKQRIFYSYVVFIVSSLLFSILLLTRVIFGADTISFGVFTDITTTVLGAWNNVGIFFGITGLLSLFSLEMLRVGKGMKVLLALALAASLFFLALINFRIVWIVMAVSTFLFILYTLWSTKPVASDMSSAISSSTSSPNILSRLPYISLVICILSIACVVWGTLLGGYLSTTFGINNLDVRPSLSVTVDIIRSTMQDHPLFGSGPNTFVTQWLSYKPNDVVGTQFWNTDFAYGIGLIPTFAVTTGMLGLLSWLLFFGFYMFVGVKSLFTRMEDAFERFLVTSSFFVSLFLWIMAWVYIPSSAILVLTFFFTGLFFASLYMSQVIPVASIVLAENPKRGFVLSLLMVVLCVGIASLGFGLLKNSRSLWYFQKSSYALNTSGDTVGAEEYMNKAISIVPTDVYYRSLSEINLVELNSIVLQDPTKITPEALQKQVGDSLSKTITAAVAARDANPSNYQNWTNLGRVYHAVVPLKIQGAYESAAQAYSEAFRRNPKNPAIYLLMAQLEADNGSLANAKNYAFQAIQAKQNYLDAYFLLAQIEIADKNLKGAIDSVTALTVLSPSDPNVFFQLGYLKFNNGDFAGAIEALEKSLTLSPQYANAKYYLGVSYEAVRDHEKALQQFRDLRASNPDSKEVADILTLLEAGKSIFTAPQTNTKPGAALPVKERE